MQKRHSKLSQPSPQVKGAMIAIFYKVLEARTPKGAYITIFKPNQEGQVILAKGKLGQFRLNWPRVDISIHLGWKSPTPQQANECVDLSVGTSQRSRHHNKIITRGLAKPTHATRDGRLASQAINARAIEHATGIETKRDIQGTLICMEWKDNPNGCHYMTFQKENKHFLCFYNEKTKTIIIKDLVYLSSQAREIECLSSAQTRANKEFFDKVRRGAWSWSSSLALSGGLASQPTEGGQDSLLQAKNQTSESTEKFYIGYLVSLKSSSTAPAELCGSSAAGEEEPGFAHNNNAYPKNSNNESQMEVNCIMETNFPKGPWTGTEKPAKEKGTLREQVKNIMTGITQGFTVNLELKGIGYQAKLGTAAESQHPTVPETNQRSARLASSILSAANTSLYSSSSSLEGGGQAQEYEYYACRRLAKPNEVGRGVHGVSCVSLGRNEANGANGANGANAANAAGVAAVAASTAGAAIAEDTISGADTISRIDATTQPGEATQYRRRWEFAGGCWATKSAQFFRTRRRSLRHREKETQTPRTLRLRILERGCRTIDKRKHTPQTGQLEFDIQRISRLQQLKQREKNRSGAGAAEENNNRLESHHSGGSKERTRASLFAVQTTNLSQHLRNQGSEKKQSRRVLILNTGHSHEVTWPLYTKDVCINVPSLRQGGAVTLSIFGISRSVVNQVAAEIYSLKKPEPYKGKGIRYDGEKLFLKRGRAKKG